MDSPLARSKPAGAAAAHEPVPEDEDGGQQAYTDVQHEHDAGDVFVGDMFEVGMKPVYLREDEFYNFSISSSVTFTKVIMMLDTMFIGMMIK